MPATRKRFNCGHRGFGQFCHRCVQADTFEKKAVEASQSKDIEANEKYRLKAEALRATGRR